MLNGTILLKTRRSSIRTTRQILLPKVSTRPRGWFFTLHAIAVMLCDSVAFKNVISNGLVLDKNGNKMSKRKGNVVNPFETLEQYGADLVRWYMIENAPHGII
jgi:isoleucyl-tRNA synthetase